MVLPHVLRAFLFAQIEPPMLFAVDLPAQSPLISCQLSTQAGTDALLHTWENRQSPIRAPRHC